MTERIEVNTRLRGARQLLFSTALLAIGLRWLLAEQSTGANSNTHQIAFYGLAVLGGSALAGLIQAVCGVSFAQLSDSWNALKGWQRGVFGIGILLLLVVVVFGSLTAYAVYGA
jgi:hypothetical protein